jgi:hypothetical protein
MGREISLFSNYHQDENSVTNYCGLILKLLYEESPSKFEELLTNLLPNNVDISVGPYFSQQTKSKKSIPDLAITQRSLSVFFETKLTNWFYNDQIKRHIEGFNQNTETKVLFLLSNFQKENYEEQFHQKIKEAKDDGVIIQPLSFEDFVTALEGVIPNEDFENMLNDFKAYLDRTSLLPKWKYLLDVVNCRGTMFEIDKGHYICPNKGGAYSHRRAKYFGPYANKAVKRIFEIDGIVVVDKNLGETSIKWKNTDIPNEELMKKGKAIIAASEWRSNENKHTALQVFILSNSSKTSFKKISSGGMMQSKKYFWDIARNVKTAKELADNLNGKTWK